MRNLKRVLSLALATVMLLGMMVMGTGAANVSDFTDSDKITNLEAASVTTALEIFSGYGDGTFRGENYVNRAEMATIICKILLGSKVNADIYKGIGSFQDLAGYEWAEGYINMCHSQGIVNGAGGNNYEPGRPVRTWEAALMLQRALGWWDKNDPLNATISELTVSSKSGSLGLYGDLTLNANDYLTRNDVAEMVFNAITKCVPVEYNESFRLYRNASSPDIFSGVVFSYFDTLAYQTFGLVYDVDTADAFGRPATTWGYGKLNSGSNGNIDSDGNIKPSYNGMTTELAVVPDTPVVEYTTAVKNNTLYNALGMKKSDSFTLFVDGRETVTATIGRNSTNLKDANAQSITGNGVLTQVFNNPQYDGTTTSNVSPYIVVVINTYVMGVDGVYEAKGNQDAYVTVKALDNNVAGMSYPYSSNEFDDSYTTEDFERDDVVLVTVALEDPEATPESINQYKIQTMQLADYANGNLTQYSRTNGTATVDGVVYSFSKNTNQYAHNYIEVGGALKDDVVVYLDNYGYAVDVQKVSQEEFNDYALVIAVDKDSSDVFQTNNAWVKMVVADGSTVTGKFTWTAADKDNPEIGKGDELSYKELTDGKDYDKTKETLFTTIRQLVTYSVDKDGVYTLKNPGDVGMTGLQTENNESIVKDHSLGSYQKIGFLNSASIMFVESESGKFKVYTGVKTVPTIKDESSDGAYVLNAKKNGLIDALYTTAQVEGSTSSDLIYIVAEDHWVNDKDMGAYVVYTAIVNGEVTELNIKGSVQADKTVTVALEEVKPGAVFTHITERNGIVTAVEAGKGGHPDAAKADYYEYTGFIRANRTVIGVGKLSGNKWYYTWADDVQVVYVDENLNVSTPSITNIKTNESVKTVYGVSSNNAGEITWIYVIEVPETRTYTVTPSRATDLFTIEGVYFQYEADGRSLSSRAAYRGTGTWDDPYIISKDIKAIPAVVASFVAARLKDTAAVNAKYYVIAEGATVKMVEREAGEGAPDVYNISVSTSTAAPEDINEANKQITGTISITVPTKVNIGEKLPTAADIKVSDSRVVIQSITWTSPKGVSDVENAEDEGKYTATITVAADTGYTLMPGVMYRVNGGIAKSEIDKAEIEVKATTNDDDKIVIPNPIKITVENVDVKLNATLPTAADVKPANSFLDVTSITWKDQYNQEVSEGTHVGVGTYTGTIVVAPKAGYTLDANPKYIVNEGDESSTATLTIKVEPDAAINSVAIEMKTEVTTKDAVPVAESKTTGVTATVTGWKDAEGSTVTPDASLTEGKYTATIKITDDDGYQLAKGYTVTVNDEKVDVNASDEVTVKVTVTKAPDETINGTIDITVNPTTITTEQQLPEGSAEKVNVVIAWDKDATELEVGEYTGTITVTPKDGYVLGANVSYTVNGQPAEMANGKPTVKVTVTEATTPATPKEIKGPVAITIADLVAGEDLPDAETTVEGVVLTTEWKDKDGQDATKAGQAGETYTAVITVEADEGYTLKATKYTVNDTEVELKDETLTVENIEVPDDVTPPPEEKTAATIDLTLPVEYTTEDNMPEASEIKVTVKKDDGKTEISGAAEKVTVTIEWKKDGSTASDFTTQGVYTATIGIDTSAVTDADKYTFSYTLNGKDSLTVTDGKATQNVTVYKVINAVTITLSKNQIADGSKTLKDVADAAQDAAEEGVVLTITWTGDSGAVDAENTTPTDGQTFTATIKVTADSGKYFELDKENDVTYTVNNAVDPSITNDEITIEDVTFSAANP